MRHPFSHQPNNAEFARDKRARLNQITRLRIARSWSLLTLIPGTLLLALVPLSGSPDALSVALPLLCLAATIAGCLQLNRQIKCLEKMATKRE